MSDAYTEAYREALATAPRDNPTVETLSISHPDKAQTIYLANNSEELVANLEDGTEVTFRPVGFAFTLPKQNSTGVQELSVTLSNINQEASDFVLSIATSDVPATLKWRPYLLSDLTQPQMNPPITLFLRSSILTDHTVVAKASFADLLNKPFISRLYTRDRFPSLSYS